MLIFVMLVMFVFSFFAIETKIASLERPSSPVDEEESLDDYFTPFRMSSSRTRPHDLKAPIPRSRLFLKNDADFDPERDFHAPAYEKIRNRVNAGNILSWTKTTDKFFQELNMTVLTPDIDIERIHGRSDDEKNRVWSDTTRYYVWETNICYAARGFARAGRVKTHVLFTYLNENRGAFTRDIPDRTIEWDNLATNWKRYVVSLDVEVYDL